MTSPQTHAPSALLSYGFRPFFLAAAIWATVDVAIWMSLFEHGGGLPSRFDPLTWHIHEMLFGLVMAAIAGFLLTAVANWTGRPPVRGSLLGCLAAVWLAGRIACSLSLWLPPVVAPIADLALPVLLAVVVGREIIAAGNWRNLAMIAPVTLLGISNLLMHLQSLGVAIPDGLGWRLGLVAVLILISAIGGRIIPAFTGNWLAKRGEEGPAPKSALDRVALAGFHAPLLLWSFFPDSRLVGAMLLAGAGLTLWRLLRWRGMKARREPLLFILHVGYAWLVLGMTLLGLSTFAVVPLSAALHSLTVGAAATMILAVMARATRGHTGRSLTSDRITNVIFALISAAALARVTAGFGVLGNPLLVLSALLWSAAFLLFLWGYGPMLLRPVGACNGMPPDDISREIRPQ